MDADRLTILMTANSMANLAHFRAPLFAALAHAGYEITAVAPDDLTGEGPPARRLPIVMDRGGTNPIKDAATWLAYLRILRSERPQAVLSFTPKANIYAGLATRALRIPFLPTVSGLGTAFLKGGWLRGVQLRLYRLAFARSPIVFFQNADDADAFVSAGIVRSGQARIVPGSGIDLDQFAPSGYPDLNDGPFRLLFIGRLLVDKGVRELMAAVRQMRADGRAVSLTIVGAIDDGNPSSIHGAEIATWQDEGLAVFAGSVDDVRPFISSAHAVVLPSYREGLPRSLLEAAAMARPMVATDVPGCRELVVDELTGLRCQPADVASLADILGRLIDLPGNQLAQMGRQARKLAERKFYQGHVASIYLRALAELGVDRALKPNDDG